MSAAEDSTAMRRFMRPALGLALAAMASLPGCGLYTLADNPEIGQLDRIPTCGDPSLAIRVIDRFNEVERTYWNGVNTMTGVENLTQRGFHPARDDKVARRWCEGTALFADGARRRMALELSADTNFVGIGPGLAYCVVGLDRHFTYAPNCRVLRHREF
jgi:hypothetical protein